MVLSHRIESSRGISEGRKIQDFGQIGLEISENSYCYLLEYTYSMKETSKNTSISFDVSGPVFMAALPRSRD